MPFDYDDPYVEIECTIVDASPKAVKVRLSSTRDIHWVPRSCLHGGQESRVAELQGDELKLKVRRWFAQKEGLV